MSTNMILIRLKFLWMRVEGGHILKTQNAILYSGIIDDFYNQGQK